MFDLTLIVAQTLSDLLGQEVLPQQHSRRIVREGEVQELVKESFHVLDVAVFWQFSGADNDHSVFWT